MAITNSANQSAQPAQKSQKSEKRRLIVLFLFLVAAVIVAFIWWHNYNKYITSDDANLDSFRIDVAPLMTGRISTFFVAEGDTVAPADPLFELKIEGAKTYRVNAPASGVIAKQWALPGDVVNAGQTVFTLNKENRMWVAVYLEETKFSHIFLGQQAKFTLDAYDKLTFYGKIFYIGDNAASEFALVPPNNASGNYTKVTQRIPIKISIDSIAGDPLQKKRMKLISGMSATVKIEKQQ